MNKINKFIKNEKGSISMFAIVSVLFIIFILVTVYANYANKLNVQGKHLSEIKNNYGKYASLEGLDKLYTGLTGEEEEEEIIILPAEYQQVEYIESTGTQYINTGVQSTNAKVEIDFKFNEVNNKSQVLVNCSFNTGGWFGLRSTGLITLDGNDFDTEYNTRSFYTIEYKDGSTTATDENGNAKTKALEPNTQFTLFGAGAISLGNFGSLANVYRAKIYEADILVRDFIPCYRISDGIVGLYDLVEGKFYTDAAGGNFEKGPNVGLPAEYQQVEYIESTGTQWIDTGIELATSDSFSLETEVLFASTGTRQVIGNYQGRYFEVNSSGKYAIYYKTDIAASTDSFDKITLSHNGSAHTSSLYINDVLGITRTTSNDPISSTDLNKLPLFCTYNKTPQLFAHAKLKATKITLNNILARHFIPCYRISDGKVGLYDLVEDKFYTDAAGGNFEKGPDVGLPSEYKRLEYIESTGTQYIDTNYICSSDDKPIKIESEFQFMQQGTASNYLFGTLKNTGNEYPLTFGTSATEKKWMFGHYNSSGTSAKFGTFDTNQHKVKYVFNKGIYLDGILQKDTVAQACTSSNSEVSLVLFAARKGTTISSYSCARIYSFKIYEGDNILARDFIPCYKIEEGIVGLYDLVEGKFYTDGAGGGFIRPQTDPYLKLPTSYQQVEYIESTGTQYIDTNYICSSDDKPIKIESEFQFMQQGTASNYLFGTLKNTGNEYPLTFGTSATEKKWMFGHYNSGKLEVGNKSVRFGTFDTNKHKVKYAFNEGIYIDESLQEDTVAQACTSSNSGVSLVLFAARKGTTISSYSCARIYSFKIYEGDNVLARNYIPCYRKSDGKVGLFDLMEGAFYSDKAGGDFEKGPNV